MDAHRIGPLGALGLYVVNDQGYYYIYSEKYHKSHDSVAETDSSVDVTLECVFRQYEVLISSVPGVPDSQKSHKPHKGKQDQGPVQNPFPDSGCEGDDCIPLDGSEHTTTDMQEI